jgi:hypothetical protein
MFSAVGAAAENGFSCSGSGIRKSSRMIGVPGGLLSGSGSSIRKSSRIIGVVIKRVTPFLMGLPRRHHSAPAHLWDNAGPHHEYIP